MRPEWRMQRGGRRGARWQRAPPLSLAGGGKEAAGAEEGEGNGGGEEREREGAREGGGGRQMRESFNWIQQKIRVWEYIQ